MHLFPVDCLRGTLHQSEGPQKSMVVALGHRVKWPKVFNFNSWYLSHRLCRDYLTRRDCRPFSGHQELKGYSTLSLPQASPVYFAISLPFSLESHVLLMAGGNLGGLTPL